MSLAAGLGLSKETMLREQRDEGAGSSERAVSDPREREDARLYLRAPIRATDLEGMNERLVRLLADAGTRFSTIILDVRDLERANGGTVDALARLQLTAKRAGSEIFIEHAGARLLELIDLCGLSTALPVCRRRLQTGGESEKREQTLGVEKEDDPVDPVI